MNDSSTLMNAVRNINIEIKIFEDRLAERKLLGLNYSGDESFITYLEEKKQSAMDKMEEMRISKIVIPAVVATPEPEVVATPEPEVVATPDPVAVVYADWDRSVEYHLGDIVSFGRNDYILFNEPEVGHWINRFIADHYTTDHSSASWFGLSVPELLRNNPDISFNGGGGANGSRYITFGTPVYGGANPGNEPVFWKTY